MGWRYLKLDFTYAPSFAGGVARPDAARRAQRVRAGYDAIRRGAGDDTFLLGCGAPLGPCIGVVDGMRIGPDVAPWWAPPRRPRRVRRRRAVHAERAAQHDGACVPASAAVAERSRLPDAAHRATRELDAEQVETWARVVAASGGMALVSDDLALLDAASLAASSTT